MPRYRMIIDVDAPSADMLGIKEDAAMYYEKHGDVRLIEIKEIVPEHVWFGNEMK